MLNLEAMGEVERTEWINALATGLYGGNMTAEEFVSLEAVQPYDHPQGVLWCAPDQLERALSYIEKYVDAFSALHTVRDTVNFAHGVVALDSNNDDDWGVKFQAFNGMPIGVLAKA